MLEVLPGLAQALQSGERAWGGGSYSDPRAVKVEIHLQLAAAAECCQTAGSYRQLLGFNSIQLQMPPADVTPTFSSYLAAAPPPTSGQVEHSMCPSNNEIAK